MTITGVVSYLQTVLGHDRVYPVHLPDAVIYPAVRYHQVAGERVVTHDGDAGLSHARWQFSVFAESYAEAHETAEAIAAALSGWKGGLVGAAFVVSELDLYEPTDRLYHKAVDVRMIGD